MAVQTPGSPDAAETVTAVIDGITVTSPKGTLIIRAAERIGIEIPRFCDHPLLEPVAACRMCLVEIEGMPKPQPSCAVPLADGMVVKTGQTSAVAEKAQRGVMEFLLINHPLDCPMCDKGGECPLQNQEMSHGNGVSRFAGTKRAFRKPVEISAQILLDRERCISCTRCVRFADEIAGDPLIDLEQRGSLQQIGTGGDEPFDSYFSGNTIQICPVGALTSADYRFRARPFDLVSAPGVCEHCASGCAMRTDIRRERVQRRLAGDDPEVNEEWNCDKGRFAFKYQDERRLCTPLIREGSEYREASWPEAVEFAAAGLKRATGRTAVFTGGRLTREDAYAYAKFARVALATDDIDFRARPASREEADFLARTVAGSGLGVTYRDLDAAPFVLLVGIEPEEEAPMVFLRLRRAARRRSTRVAALAPWVSEGLTKTWASVIPTRPGSEAAVLKSLADGGGGLGEGASAVADDLRRPGSVIMVGERLATSSGAFAAAEALASATGARLAWVPRRAGDRGALDAGALAGVLPGGGLVANPAEAAAVAAIWGLSSGEIPSRRGRTMREVLEAAKSGISQAPSAAVIAGVDPADLADRDDFMEFVQNARFVVSLETRHTAVTAEADVVLPVAVDTERAGSYVNWEGRVRTFGKALRHEYAMTDARWLALLAVQMGTPIGAGDVAELAAELDAMPRPEGRGPTASGSPTGSNSSLAGPALREGEALLATWRTLLDLGTLQEGARFLAGTRRPAVARMSEATAASIGASDGDTVSVASDRGSVNAPLVVSDMPDSVVWIPGNCEGSSVIPALGALPGQVVRISAGGEQ